MRKVSGATVATILGVALYFTLFWGFDALRMLTSPTYGLEDVWRSQSVFGIGRMFSLAPTQLIQLAAFLGTLKLAVAAICAIHIADRIRSLANGKPVSDVFEVALLLVVAISIATAGPALWSQNIELMREQVIQLALAGLATALFLVERSYGRTDDTEPVAVEAETHPGTTWYAPWR